jgi:hypothetical protein
MQKKPCVHAACGSFAENLIPTGLYTAVTRATEKLYMVNFDEKYIK